MDPHSSLLRSKTGCSSANLPAGEEGVQARPVRDGGGSIKALDLFCGAGGASMGLHRAGFEVTGVDIAPQKNYPFKFIQGNALDADLSGYDFVWASPPCQSHSSLKRLTGKEYECFIVRTREKLAMWEGPYIIENVVGAPLINPVRLCGSYFKLGVWRHRLFEANFKIEGVECRHSDCPEPVDVTGRGNFQKTPRLKPGGGKSRKPFNVTHAGQVMGIDWMTRRELSQSIPPAYSEYLSRQFVAQTV